MINKISILGGGPAGLSAGYFLNRQGCSFSLYEASDRVGGNCVTLERNGYRFDTGAHRFHDKDPEVTQMLTDLMGDELLHIHAPSAIYSGGKLVDFPLSPINLLQKLGPFVVLRATIDWVRTKKKGHRCDNFESLAVERYGRSIADRFLLNYSQKLWGLRNDQLSPSISGGRLKGLTLKTFLLEGLWDARRKTEHLDGTFYYPRSGYGAIVESLADACGRDQIFLKHRVTGIQHDDHRVCSIEVNRSQCNEMDYVISTLPLPALLAHMKPSPPAPILALARKLKFRDVLLIGLLLDRSSVTPFATLYFPESIYPFTRVYEPRNRSVVMAPPNKTSLFIEVPYAQGEVPTEDEAKCIIADVQNLLSKEGFFSDDEVTDAFSLSIPYAYPVLELGFEDILAELYKYLSRFENMMLAGRNGRFEYAHLHNMLRWGMDVAAACPQVPGGGLESIMSTRR